MAAVYKSSNPQAGKIFATFNINSSEFLSHFEGKKHAPQLVELNFHYRSPSESLCFTYVTWSVFLRDLKEKNSYRIILSKPFFFGETQQYYC